MKTFVALISGFLLAVGVTQPGQAAGVLFGLQVGNPNLITIDPATGIVTDSFPLPGGPPSSLVAGLSGAEGGTTLIYTEMGPGTPLYRINPLTGNLLSTHALPISDRGGLSYQTEPGVDLILSINNGSPLIQQLGFDGPIQPVGASGYTFPGALGGDDMGRHFASRSLALQEIDANGVVLNSGGGFGQLQGLAFDGDFVYAVNASGMLFTIDPDSLMTVNSVPLIGGTGGGGFIGLGVAAPEPSTALLGLLAWGMVALRRRRN